MPLGPVPERMLSKGDCDESGYSEVMSANLYLIAGCSNRVLMYVGHMFFLTLYMRTAMSCSRRLCRVDSPAIDSYHDW